MPDFDAIVSDAELAIYCIFAAASFLGIAAGSVSGKTSRDVYAKLNKPSWAPPPWVYGLVWIILYILIGLSFWTARRTVVTVASIPWTTALFWITNSFFAGWPRIFFHHRMYGTAAFQIVVSFLLVVGAAIAAGVETYWLPAVLLIPVCLWVLFAAVLNIVIWRRQATASASASRPQSGAQTTIGVAPASFLFPS